MEKTAEEIEEIKNAVQPLTAEDRAEIKAEQAEIATSKPAQASPAKDSPAKDSSAKTSAPIDIGRVKKVKTRGGQGSK